MVVQALLLSLGICVASAVLEGVLAGPGVKRRMTELRLPPYSPPFGGWIGIALVYYAACFVVLYRLFANHARSSAGTSALVLIVTIVGINAAWNYLFFRQRDVRASFWVSVPYAMLAVALVALLFRTDYVAAWAFLPYVVYLGYAAWWGYTLWRLNDPKGAA